MTNLPTFLAATLGETLAYELTLLVGLVIIIQLHSLFIVLKARLERR